MELFEKELRAAGFKVMAVTKFSDGLSFDAHRVVGRRRLIKGDRCQTPELAAANLKRKCGVV